VRLLCGAAVRPMGLDPASTVVSCGGSFTSRKLLLSLMTVSLVFLVAASCDDKDPQDAKTH